MPGLRDEVAADQGAPTKCSLCIWLKTLKPADRAEWVEVLTDRTFSHTSVFRALDRRSTPVKSSSVETHRRQNHKL